MSMIISFVVFVVTMYTIYRYLRSSFHLLKEVRSSAPVIWEQLGKPQVVRYRSHGGGFGYHVSYTIQPLWPWLRWVWEANPRELDGNLNLMLQETSQLLRKSIVMLIVTFAVFYLTIVVFPPG